MKQTKKFLTLALVLTMAVGIFVPLASVGVYAEASNVYTAADFTASNWEGNLLISDINGGVDFSNALVYESGFSPYVFADKSVDLDENPYFLVRLQHTDVPYAIGVSAHGENTMIGGGNDNVTWLHGNQWGADAAAINGAYDLTELLGVTGQQSIRVVVYWHTYSAGYACDAVGKYHINFDLLKFSSLAYEIVTEATEIRASEIYETNPNAHSVDVISEDDQILLTNAIPYVNVFYPDVAVDKYFDIDNFPYFYVNISKTDVPTGIYFVLDDDEANAQWVNGSNQWGANIAGANEYYNLKELFPNASAGVHKVSFRIRWHDYDGRTPCDEAHQRFITIGKLKITDVPYESVDTDTTIKSTDFSSDGNISVSGSNDEIKFSNAVIYEQGFTHAAITADYHINIDKVGYLKLNIKKTDIPFSFGISADGGANYTYVIGTAYDGELSTGIKTIDLKNVLQLSGVQLLKFQFRWMTWNPGYPATEIGALSVDFNSIKLSTSPYDLVEGIYKFTAPDFTSNQLMAVGNENGFAFTNKDVCEYDSWPAIIGTKYIDVDENPNLAVNITGSDVPYALCIIADYDNNGFTDSMKWVVGNRYGGTTAATNQVYDLKSLLGISGKHNITVAVLWHGTGDYHCSQPQQRHINVENIVSYGDALPDGDLDGDFEITSLDLTILKKYIFGATDICGADAADVNGDGNIDILDYIRLKKIILG